MHNTAQSPEIEHSTNIMQAIASAETKDDQPLVMQVSTHTRLLAGGNNHVTPTIGVSVAHHQPHCDTIVIQWGTHYAYNSLPTAPGINCQQADTETQSLDIRRM